MSFSEFQVVNYRSTFGFDRPVGYCIVDETGALPAWEEKGFPYNILSGECFKYSDGLYYSLFATRAEAENALETFWATEQ